MLVTSCLTVPKASKHEPKQKIERETIEWCDVMIPFANKNDKPRILLIGDSITKAYYRSVYKHLGGKAYCAKFTTSACVSDPAFHKQLKTMFCQYKYAVIHFNNGLHGIGCTKEKYRVGYEKALKLIKKQSPTAILVLALSTPVQSTSDNKHLNSLVDDRNKIVLELAKKYGAEINDLHSISKDHPEYFRDTYHYKENAIELQAMQVSKTINKLLVGEQENKPDKK
jgi:hypothetical protein